jgi:hypothetical protein
VMVDQGFQKSFSVVQWFVCLPFDPRFAGSIVAEDNVFLRAIKSTAHLFWRGNEALGPML